MKIEKLENGNLLIPKRAEADDDGDGVIGDGVEEITPDHPEYQKWQKWLDADNNKEQLFDDQAA